MNPVRTALIVTGMHRSGTSALARVLNILGAELPQNVMPPQPDNPTGFWEPRELVELHEEILNSINSSWDDPVAIQPFWEDKEIIKNYNIRINEIIENEYDNSSLFVMKDPRISRFIPFTIKALQNCNIKPKFLIMIRNPLEVAESLRVRNSFHISKSLILWLDYTLNAERFSRGYPRVFVSYHKLLQDWEETLRDCEKKLDIRFPYWDEMSRDKIKDFLQSTLRHHSSKAEDVDIREDVSKWVKTAYEILGNQQGSNNEIQIRKLDSLYKEYITAQNAFGAILVQERLSIEPAIESLKEELQSLRFIAEKEGQEKNRLSKELIQERSRTQAEITALEERIEMIYSSSSWKITAPLRMIGNILRKAVRLIRRKYPIADKIIARIRGQKYLLIGYPGLKTKQLQYKPVIKNIDPKKIEFIDEKNPEISIVIPVYGQCQTTLQCLQALRDHVGKRRTEIIIVDDASPDNTNDIISKIPGIRYIKNGENYGFIYSCNKGSELARAPYIFFLNNDALIQDGTLDELIRTFDEQDMVGLAGSKLFFEDGSLQEAGAIVWNDGSAWNIGRGDDPRKPEYNYVREVDYCSGAAIMIPSKLWKKLEGFDDYYSRAYYEDTDLAFRVRRAGLRVLYQPFSKVLHLEGITSGNNQSTGEKKYQKLNSELFAKRWHEVLACHRPNGVHPEVERDRYVEGRVLIIDERTPMENHDSGSLDVINQIRMLHQMRYKTTFVPQGNYTYMGEHTDKLQKLGTECLYKPYVNKLRDHLVKTGKWYDYVIIHRVNVFNETIDDIEDLCPNACIIFNTTDLHFLREERQANLNGDSELKRQAKKTRETEINMMRKAHITIVVSSYEKEMIEREYPDVPVFHLPLIRDMPGSLNPYSERHDIGFIGGFQHPPNKDAVLFFVDKIWPHIRKKLPDANLIVAGSNMPIELQRLKSVAGVIPVGYVDDIKNFFEGIRLTVAPLRFGAGAKGKVITSMSYGVPVIASSVAVEGMDCEQGKNIFVADTVEDWVKGTVEIYNNGDVWNGYSKNSINHANEYHSFESGIEKLQRILETSNQVKHKKEENIAIM